MFHVPMSAPTASRMKTALSADEIAADRGVADPGRRVAVLEGDERRDDGARQQRDLERAAGRVRAEERDRRAIRTISVRTGIAASRSDGVAGPSPGVPSSGSVVSSVIVAGQRPRALAPRRSDDHGSGRRRRGRAVLGHAALARAAREQEQQDDRQHRGDHRRRTAPARSRVPPARSGRGRPGRSCSARRRGPCPARSPAIVTTSTPASRIFEIVNVFRS